MTPAELIEFEEEVGIAFDAGKISGPVHLNSETQAEPLIGIFKEIPRSAWVLSTWRSHWHALLHGVPRQLVMDEILAGRSMMLHFPEYRFMTSAIVGGMLPIATGLAAGGEKVYCFIGDMTESIGAFRDALNFAKGDITFVIEDNGLSTNTPTIEAWGLGAPAQVLYHYERTTNHYGTKNFVSF